MYGHTYIKKQILVINIKNSATCFGSFSHHQAKHNHSTCTFSQCTHWIYQYYVLYLAWWWINEPKHVAKFLILITYICCVCYWFNYYITLRRYLFTMTSTTQYKKFYRLQRELIAFLVISLYPVMHYAEPMIHCRSSSPACDFCKQIMSFTCPQEKWEWDRMTTKAR